MRSRGMKSEPETLIIDITDSVISLAVNRSSGGAGAWWGQGSGGHLLTDACIPPAHTAPDPTPKQATRGHCLTPGTHGNRAWLTFTRHSSHTAEHTQPREARAGQSVNCHRGRHTSRWPLRVVAARRRGRGPRPLSPTARHAWRRPHQESRRRADAPSCEVMLVATPAHEAAP